MEQQQPVTEKSKGSSVGVIGLVVLCAATFLIPNILPFVAPEVLFDSPHAWLTLSSLMAIVALVVGVAIGIKIPVQKERIKNALGVGFFTLIFIHLVVLPGNAIGVRSIIAYTIVLVLPTLVGALLGGLKKRA